MITFYIGQKASRRELAALAFARAMNRLSKTYLVKTGIPKHGTSTSILNKLKVKHQLPHVNEASGDEK